MNLTPNQAALVEEAKAIEKAFASLVSEATAQGVEVGVRDVAPTLDISLKRPL